MTYALGLKAALRKELKGRLASMTASSCVKQGLSFFLFSLVPSLPYPPPSSPSLPPSPFLPSSLPPFLPSSLPPFLPSSLPPSPSLLEQFEFQYLISKKSST